MARFDCMELRCGNMFAKNQIGFGIYDSNQSDNNRKILKDCINSTSFNFHPFDSIK